MKVEIDIALLYYRNVGIDSVNPQVSERLERDSLILRGWWGSSCLPL